FGIPLATFLQYLSGWLAAVDLWGTVQNLLRFVVVLGVLISVHELGHFLVAKWSRVRVHEFAIGFGPALLKKRIGETLYAVRALPLGGFVRMAGMEPAENLPAEADPAE